MKERPLTGPDRMNQLQDEPDELRKAESEPEWPECRPEGNPGSSCLFVNSVSLPGVRKWEMR